MTRAVYVIGGAGTGKSTFTAQLLKGFTFGPFIDIHATPNSKGRDVTLRGHVLTGGFENGLYVGKMRDGLFPGTDALERICSIPGKEWLNQGVGLPPWLVSEGATLATRPFLTALASATRLLLVHLYLDDVVKDLRLYQRGTGQDEKFVQGTATRSANLLRDLPEVPQISFDAGSPRQWSAALQRCSDHLW